MNVLIRPTLGKISATLFLAFLCSSHSTRTWNDLKGKLLDQASLEPIENATIVVQIGEKNIVGQSDAEGHFRFPSLENGQYRVRIEKTGYDPANIEGLELNASKEPVFLLVKMKKSIVAAH